MTYWGNYVQPSTQRPHTSHGFRDDSQISSPQYQVRTRHSYLQGATGPTSLTSSSQDDVWKKIIEENKTLKAEKARIQEENETLKGKCERYKADARNFRSRYESLISDRLSAPSIDSENLNDDLRPSAVADKWRYLKDQLYFQTYFDLHELLRDKPRAWELLLTICRNAYKICRGETIDFNKGLKDSLFDRIEKKNAEIGDVIKTGVERLFREELGERERRKLAESLQERYLRAGQALLGDTQKQAVGEIKRFRKLAEKKQDNQQILLSLFPKEMKDHQLRDICAEFAQECLLLCRAMMLQEPTMHLDFDLEPGANFRVREFDVHDGEQGEENLIADKLLLPALFRHRAGPMLEKGLATAKKKSLERPHSADPRTSRRRRHLQQDSYSGGGLSTYHEDQGAQEFESTEQESYVSERAQGSSGQGSSTQSPSDVDVLFGDKAMETNARGTCGNDKETSTYYCDDYRGQTATGQIALPRPKSAHPSVGHSQAWQ